MASTDPPTPGSQFYPHGPSSDVTLECQGGDKHCVTDRITITNLWIKENVYQKLQVNTNGLVSLGVPYDKRQPPPSWDDLFTPGYNATVAEGGLAVIAPLWADSDVSEVNVMVSYQQYDQNGLVGSGNDTLVTQVLARAKDDAETYGGFSAGQFQATWALVVTWSHIPPRDSQNQDTERVNTLQLVLMTDGYSRHTCALSLYQTTDWDAAMDYDTMVGYYASKGGGTVTYTNPYSNTANAFRLDELAGNAGDANGAAIGLWWYSLSDGDAGIFDYYQRCVDWFGAEAADPIARSGVAPCPCDYHQAQRDNSWMTYNWDQSDDPRRQCFYKSAAPSVGNKCCYNKISRALLTRENSDNGYLMRYNPSRQNRSHETYDIEPKKWCCDLSDNCDLYFMMRPLDLCTGYEPPRLGSGAGDPHVETLDGLAYTFNGLGEYVLLVTDDGDCRLQARTDYALDINGNLTEATVFSALVARDGVADALQVQLYDNRTGFEVYIGGKSRTGWFVSADDSQTFNAYQLAVTKMSDSSITGSFPSGFTVQFSQSEGLLNLVVATPTAYMNRTRGLLGVLNGDVTDDLTARDGTVLPSNSPEDVIFKDFGETWRIQNIDESVFYYTGESTFYWYSDLFLLPTFMAELNVSDEVRANCSDSYECMYDTVTTGNINIGVASRDIVQENAENKAELENNRPALIGHTTFNVTVGELAVYTLDVSDADDDNVTVTMTMNTNNTDAVFDQSTLTLEWTPETMETVTFTFEAVDSRGGFAAPLSPEVKLCNCSHGDCSSVEEEGREATPGFKVLACVCDTGWAGPRCDLDDDGCLMTPCRKGSNCTDLRPEEEAALGVAFNCSACPAGYQNDIVGQDCIDLDECLLKPCQDQCQNTDGGFWCSCDAFSRLVNTTQCEDIDECKEGRSGCQQRCINLDPGYICSCLEGYELNDVDNKTCIDVGSICDQAGLNCSNGCVNDTGTPTCFCPDGYRTGGSNNDICEDVDECQESPDPCEQDCYNDVPGYTCSCRTGYLLQPDGHTCQACPAGNWGEGCTSACNCGTDVRDSCNVTLGCTACDDGLTGPDCVNINECATPGACGDNATCEDKHGTYTCECDPGYTPINGTHCQPTDHCGSNDQCNNGVCVNQPFNYICTCEAGYTGSVCETDIDECAGMPCEHNASCIDKVNDYECRCTGDWMGLQCHIPIENGTRGDPPTVMPTTEPTTIPTTEPTTLPTTEPTTIPTTLPTTEPTTLPTTEPTTIPTTEPTTLPTTEPTTKPTTEPTTIPTTEPTTIPTTEPTTLPRAEPTTEPTTLPTAEPGTEPTAPTPSYPAVTITTEGSATTSENTTVAAEDEPWAISEAGIIALATVLSLFAVASIVVAVVYAMRTTRGHNLPLPGGARPASRSSGGLGGSLIRPRGDTVATEDRLSQHSDSSDDPSHRSVPPANKTYRHTLPPAGPSADDMYRHTLPADMSRQSLRSDQSRASSVFGADDEEERYRDLFGAFGPQHRQWRTNRGVASLGRASLGRDTLASTSSGPSPESLYEQRLPEDKLQTIQEAVEQASPVDWSVMHNFAANRPAERGTAASSVNNWDILHRQGPQDAHFPSILHLGSDNGGYRHNEDMDGTDTLRSLRTPSSRSEWHTFI